jgi:hypothetical protein
MRRRARRKIAEEGVDGSEPRVARPRAVAALLLQVVEERGDQRCVEVRHIQSRGGLPAPQLSKRQEQTERVAVGGNGMGAGEALPLEALGEEGFQQRCEHAHGCPRSVRSRRASA